MLAAILETRRQHSGVTCFYESFSGSFSPLYCSPRSRFPRPVAVAAAAVRAPRSRATTSPWSAIRTITVDAARPADRPCQVHSAEVREAEDPRGRYRRPTRRRWSTRSSAAVIRTPRSRTSPGAGRQGVRRARSRRRPRTKAIQAAVRRRTPPSTRPTSRSTGSPRTYLAAADPPLSSLQKKIIDKLKAQYKITDAQDVRTTTTRTRRSTSTPDTREVHYILTKNQADAIAARKALMQGSSSGRGARSTRSTPARHHQRRVHRHQGPGRDQLRATPCSASW